MRNADDTTPTLTEHEGSTRHKKKRGGKKPLVVEARVRPDVVFKLPLIEKLMEGKREWHVFRRYKSGRHRDEAIKALQRSVRHHSLHRYYEFRMPDSTEEVDADE